MGWLLPQETRRFKYHQKMEVKQFYWRAAIYQSITEPKLALLQAENKELKVVLKDSVDLLGKSTEQTIGALKRTKDISLQYEETLNEHLKLQKRDRRVLLFLGGKLEQKDAQIETLKKDNLRLGGHEVSGHRRHYSF